jgi:HSP20 family protein
LKEDAVTETNLQKKEASPVERVASAPTVAPLVDIYETKDALFVVADLPGVDQDAVSVEMKDDQLVLRGDRRAQGEDDPWRAIYERSFRLPPGVDGEKVRAQLKDGVLTLELPKPEQLKPRKIAVRAA